MGWVQNTISPQGSVQKIGPIPTLKAKCPQLVCEEGNFLLDTGANVSLISKNALKKGVTVCKSEIPVKSSSGDMVKILGSISLDLFTDQHNLDSHHFWITDQVFPRYCGIVGTDFLGNLHATIQCGGTSGTNRAQRELVERRDLPPLSVRDQN
jgi:hypothetical protein